jgi:hypothetical protein
VNLPLSLYGPLVEKGVAPQALVVELGWSFAGKPSKAYVGWTGLASRLPNLAAARQQADTLEIDAQFARELGLRDGQQVWSLPLCLQYLSVLPADQRQFEAFRSSSPNIEHRAAQRRRLGGNGKRRR